MSSPTLPQNDPDQDARRRLLEDRRAKYAWDHEFLAPLALLYEPGTNHPSLRQALVDWRFGLLPPDTNPGMHYLFARLHSLEDLAKNSIRTYGISKKKSFSNINEYSEVFKSLPRPPVVDSWRDDAEFAWQRVAGTNPNVLTQISHLAPWHHLKNQHLPMLRNLQLELAAGHIYVCDYSILEGLPPISDEFGTRYSVPTVGYFLATDDGLKPLAIQVGLDETSPIYTPNDGGAWQMAKICMQSNDLNHHEMATHLIGTHFLLEGCAVAAARTLSTRHPISVLLVPHFRILLWNNFEGRELLTNPGGMVSKLLAGGVDGALQTVRRFASGYPERNIPAWTFDRWDLPKDLERRGLTQLAQCPYAEDGRKVWDAIYEFLGNYLRLYYGSDDAVRQDTELQAWIAELSSDVGGKFRGVEPVQDIPGLTRFLTRIIFTSGPQHSNVNFGQYQYMAYTPNMPAALYALPPANAASFTAEQMDAFLLQLLPPPGRALFQLTVVTELTSYRFDELGAYQDGDFVDAGALAVVRQFEAKLHLLNGDLCAQNARRRRAYDLFLPTEILNSTSI